jgi:beta-N-acetylhexosaminidase
MNNRRAFIIGLKSTILTKKEFFLLKKYKPWGVILFSRNIKTIKQTKNLTTSIKNLFKDNNYPILIDQEGGRVDRFGKLINTSLFTGEFFGNLYKKNNKKFKLYYELFIRQTSFLLKQTGININTVPLLDVRRKKSNNIIGNRSYSSNHKIVSKIGDFCIKHFHKNNIGTIIKHIPGHGLSKVDSHKTTPIIQEKISVLKKIDFFPFKNKKSFFAMTAHIIYENIDKTLTATHSSKVINIIRKDIKFNNILISDDISMKGLRYSLKENTVKSFKAGCNLVLHCNGRYDEMLIVAKNSPKIDKFIIKKTSQFYKILR